MDCRTARQLLAFDRPRVAELLPPEAELLRAHLADCPDCQARAQAEKAEDDRLARAMQDVPIPADLRQRLLIKLAAERDDWYRRWGLRAAGIAAAVVVLTWFLGLRGRDRPGIDLEAISHEAFAQKGATPQQVEEWYRQRGVAMAAPPGFDYQFLAFYNLVAFQGRQVPQLVFVRGTAYAQVFVVSQRDFDLAAAVQLAQLGSGGHTVQVLPYPSAEQPRLAFVVVCTGEALDWFRREADRPST